MYKKLITFVWVFVCGFNVQAQDLSIGSKQFPESRLLAEIMAQHIEHRTGLLVERKLGLGGTMIAFEALRNGDIDFYPEYTGTALKAILKDDLQSNHPDSVFVQVKSGLQEEFDILCLTSFGFNNTYAIISRKDSPWNTISELAKDADHAHFGFSNEFINRDDGLKGLKMFYQFEVDNINGMQHGLAYQALQNGKIDVTDAYSTDGQLQKFNFKVLKDDRFFFPPYDACPLARQETLQKYPEIEKALAELYGLINDAEMQALNYKHEVDKVPTEVVANEFLIEKGLVDHSIDSSENGMFNTTKKRLFEHIFLSLITTLTAVFIGLPLGIISFRNKAWSKVILSFSSVIQTIPSLALLGFMIPLLGIGFTPAYVALVLYSLLPIVRNTFTGMKDVDENIIESGKAMGMNNRQILGQLYLPLSARSILAGIRTSMVINIGTATLAAFIGAGGLGELIITGITLNDHELILMGAIPAALLALLADGVISWVEKRYYF